MANLLHNFLLYSRPFLVLKGCIVLPPYRPWGRPTRPFRPFPHFHHWEISSRWGGRGRSFSLSRELHQSLESLRRELQLLFSRDFSFCLSRKSFFEQPDWITKMLADILKYAKIFVSLQISIRISKIQQIKKTVSLNPLPVKRPCPWRRWVGWWFRRWWRRPGRPSS